LNTEMGKLNEQKSRE